MRGKHPGGDFQTSFSGLIPAHAGKTTPYFSIGSRSPAHPRACGENSSSVFATVPSVGSSPRMRGKLRRDLLDSLRYRLIPAHAGKTIVFFFGGLVGRAHPRACGENWRLGVGGRSFGGSSPRMRGKLRGGADFCNDRGLIPAHAGKTDWLR